MKAADTIYAVSSGSARTAICVIRISGEQSFEALRWLQGKLQPHGCLALRQLRAGKSGELLDHAMTVRFLAPKSYTAEDMVEVHCHGSPAIVEAIIEAWRAKAKLRMRAAEPGEFTRRALLAGKIDLTRAEGLIDLINAETQAQRRQALAQSEGLLSKLYTEWGERLFALLCQREALIDFPDEDLADTLPVELQKKPLAMLYDEISAHLALAGDAERVRSGVSVALVGAPNVGKSSLLNRIACLDAAIVSARAGTTRDVVRVRTEIAGLAVDLLDTAGLRIARDSLEAEGILRAKKSAQEAHIVVCLRDATKESKNSKNSGGASSGKKIGEREDSGKNISTARPDKKSPRELNLGELNLGETSLAETSIDEVNLVEPRYDFLILNKSDLLSASARDKLENRENHENDKVHGNSKFHDNSFLLSARTGEGLGEFLGALKSKLEDIPQAVAPTRVRHREALSQVCENLLQAQAGEDWALQAQALREAHLAMGRLVGTRDIEAVLDKIFADFCIGK